LNPTIPKYFGVAKPISFQSVQKEGRFKRHSTMRCRIAGRAWKVDIETMKRSRSDTPILREDAGSKERIRANRRPATGNADALANGLLRDAAREAGLFQRSALGHLDHKDWSNRVRADGQRLIDLLRDMGFSPTDNNPATLAQ
jgi:hypothetical protein